MSTSHDFRDTHNMSLGNFFLASTDSTPVMLAKATPAVGLAAVSQIDGATTFLDHFAALPWGAISGCVATIYSLCLLGEWLYKKGCAVAAWWNARKAA